MKNRSSQSLGARALLASILAAGAVPAMADAVPGMYWTHTGSAGTVDPIDLAATAFDSEIVTNVGPAAGTVDLRYNVVAVDGLQLPTFPSDGFDLVVRYRDHGSQSQVVARLYRVNIATGARAVIATFDSNGNDSTGTPFPQLSSFQTQQVTRCGLPFDFTRYAYYVSVQLVRSTPAGVLPGMPALQALQIRPTVCLI